MAQEYRAHDQCIEMEMCIASLHKLPDSFNHEQAGVLSVMTAGPKELKTGEPIRDGGAGGVGAIVGVEHPFCRSVPAAEGVEQVIESSSEGNVLATEGVAMFRTLLP